MIIAKTTRDGASRPGGFTLIEMLLVVAIIGILASIAIPSYLAFIEKARVSKAIAEIKSISTIIDGYFISESSFPLSLADVGEGGAIDPWGSPYLYLDVTTAPIGAARKDKFLVPLNTGYDLYSKGKDLRTFPPLPAPPSQDDVIRANDGGYLGLASSY